MENEIFKSSKVNINKLIKYGFKKSNSKYIYEKVFMYNSFKAIIYVDANSKVSGKVIDLSFKDEYVNFRIPNQNGKFVNKVRNEYKKILIDILNNCFEKIYFIYPQSNKICQIICNKYKVLPEFLWAKFPNYGVFRNKESKKWFGIIMNIDKSKILKNTLGEIEILNIKLGEQVNEYLKVSGIYESYHMSKKNWVSIILDNTLDDDFILNLINISFKNSK